MKKLLLLPAVAILGLPLNVGAAGQVNVAPGTIAIASQSSTLASQYGASVALNRNYGDFTHTSAEATDNWWLLDLGGPVPIHHVILFNRGGGCCPERLRDITISFFDTNNTLLLNSPLLNPGNIMGGPGSISYTNPPLNARYVKVTRTATGGDGDHGGNTLSLGEVEIHAENLAQGQPSSQSTSWPGLPAGNANNGDPANYSHTTGEATDNWWQVDLGANFEVNSVMILNRPDCCGGRFRDLTVSVLDESLAPVYSSPLLNPGNVLGGGAGDYSNGPKSLSADLRFLNGGNPVLGRYVRVTRTATGGDGNHDGNVLALAEVQVFGNPPSGTPPTISAHPQSQIGVVGGTATFTVAAVGTEPVSYQWFKNGTTLLSNETNAALVIPNLALTNAGSYSVTVSNAFGVSNSSSATLTMYLWNAARSGVASQSSTDNNGFAVRAIDGNTDGNWGNGSVTHTGNAPIDNEWWEVDLLAPIYVDRVHLWLRTDCCQTRNENLQIVIYDSAGPGRQVVWTQSVGSNPGGNQAFDVIPAVLGQVVRVEHPTGIVDVLSLAEVQVYEGPHGTNLFWVGGNPDASWDTTNTLNWDPGDGNASPFSPRDIVTFDNLGTMTDIQLVGALAPLTVNVSGDFNYSFNGSGKIIGGSLVKSGANTLTLANSQTNSFLSGTMINQGTLQIGNGGTQGALPAGPIVNNATLVINRSDDLSISGGLTGSGFVRKLGANTVTAAGANNHGGGTIVAEGKVLVQNNGALGNTASAITTVSNGATLDLNSYELWNYQQPIFIDGSGVGGVGAITKTAEGNQGGLALRSIVLNGDASIGGITNARIDIGRGDWPWPPIPNPPIHIDGQGHTLSLVGNVYLGILAGAQNLSGFVINSGTVVSPHGDNSLGNATVTLNGGTLSPWGWDRAFANPIVVNSGFIDNQGFMNTYTGPIQINGSVQLNAISGGGGGGGNITLNGNVSGAGSVTKIGGYTVLLGGDNSGFTGSYTNNESNTFFTSDTAGSAQAAWVMNGGNLANTQTNDHNIQLGSLSGNGTLANNLAMPDGGVITFTIGANNASTVFSGQIIDTLNQTGSVAIVKTGNGTLTLAGANSYTGGTLVQNGTLQYDGTLNGGSGAVVVVAGGILSGVGTLNAPVDVQVGGTLTPGNSIGTLAINGPLSLAGQTVMEINRTNVPANDAIVGITTLTEGGLLQVVNSGPDLVAGDSFLLFQATSYQGSFSSVQLPSLAPGLSWDLSQLATAGLIRVNRNPSGGTLALRTAKNQPVQLGIVKLLAVCSDLDGDSLSVTAVSNSTNGAIVALTGDSITYTPVSGFVGADRFSFTVTDGKGGFATGSVDVVVVQTPASMLNLVSAQRVGDNYYFKFAGIPGRSYQIERAIEVTGPWTNIATVVAAPAGLTTFVDTNSPAGSAFYRTVYP